MSHVVTAQRPDLVGRWVNLAPTPLVKTLVFDADGTVHQLRADGINAKFTRRDSVITLRGAVRGMFDTLLILRPANTLVSGRNDRFSFGGDWQPVENPGQLDGKTWLNPPLSSGMVGWEAYLTLHADSLAEVEWGFARRSQWRGDTLVLTGRDGFIAKTLLVRRTGDTLLVTDSTGKQHRMVQRPWGCFAIGKKGADPSTCVGWAAAQPFVPPTPPFQKDLAEMTRGAGLQSITAGVPPGQKEVRVWSGFGLTGVRLDVAAWRRGNWTTSESRNVYQVTRPVFAPWISARCWQSLWTRAAADSFYALPPSPVRPPSDALHYDGWSFVVEVADGKRYYAAGAMQPDSSLSADDRRMLRFINPLLSPKGKACASR